MTATTPTITSILCGDQPMTKEGSIILMIMGMPWDVSPVPTAITVVARIKMNVVIPNRNMCPGEWNKDPLELEKKKGVSVFSRARGGFIRK